MGILVDSTVQIQNGGVAMYLYSFKKIYKLWIEQGTFDIVLRLPVFGSLFVEVLLIFVYGRIIHTVVKLLTL